MASDTSAELITLFAQPSKPLDPPILSELRSILRLHDLTPHELFIKWEAYSIKLGGSERLNIDLQRARDLKADIQDALERETRQGKAHVRSERRGVGATPRVGAKAGDLFGMMDGVVQTPASAAPSKRKSDFATPARSKVSKPHAGSSPAAAASTSNVLFTQRQQPGEILETLNEHLPIPKPPAAPFATSRIALKANSDLKKFAYKTMAMKLSEASEILDDRIDEMLALVQEHHQLEDGAFGNPALQSTSEIVAVGRIASDTAEQQLKPGSIVLETSRRTGAGVRVPLQLDRAVGYELFPGKIVAVKGINASGEAFSVSSFLDLPPLKLPATPVAGIDETRTRLLAGADNASEPQPLNIIASAGPYTADGDLAYEPLHALIETAITSSADALVLLGPFLDTEHPLIRTGAFPESLSIDPDTATLTDVFHSLISTPLQHLTQTLPGISIILVPSVRDAVNKHTAWPQDRLLRKELGLPKQVSLATNPVMLSLNEMMVGISTQDVLYDLRWEQCVGGKPRMSDPLARLSSHLIDQRHFYPLFPPRDRGALPKAPTTDGEEMLATGAMLDLAYLALGEWYTCKPDLLITPSKLNPFAKVVDGVTVVNPGTVWGSQKSAPGSYARMCVAHRDLSEEERNEGGLVTHKVWERCRVDVVRV